jgi:hypothetical protein
LWHFQDSVGIPSNNFRPIVLAAQLEDASVLQMLLDDSRVSPTAYLYSALRASSKTGMISSIEDGRVYLASNMSFLFKKSSD